MLKSDLIEALEWIEEMADASVQDKPEVKLWKIQQVALEALGRDPCSHE